MNQLNCDVVKDLLPLYVDGMVSDSSKKGIEEHLNTCADCKKTYEYMAFGLETDKQPLEGIEVKKFLNKTKQMYFLYGLGGLSLIAVIVCLIVDLALHRGITWSLIPTAAIIFADAFVYSLLEGKEKKGFYMMCVISVGTVFLLSIIQISTYYLMNTGTFWLFRYGFPIMFIWLAALWLPVLCRYLLKWCTWDCLAVLMVTVVIGNYTTKLFTGDYGWADVWSINNFITDALGEVAGAVLFLLLKWQAKKKNKSVE